MPRLASLDAPGILQHAMGWGIEKRKIFFNDHDRQDFIDRVAGLCSKGAVTLYAWALMPNHFICY
jgi:REP element-mobilizing transposase RayT